MNCSAAAAPMSPADCVRAAVDGGLAAAAVVAGAAIEGGAVVGAAVVGTAVVGAAVVGAAVVGAAVATGAAATGVVVDTDVAGSVDTAAPVSTGTESSALPDPSPSSRARTPTAVPPRSASRS